jgi:O-antigen ligase
LNVIVYRLTKPATAEEKALNPNVSGSFTYVAVSAKSIPFAIRGLFLLFVFTFPFDSAGVGLMAGSLSVTKAFGLLFFTCYFFYNNPLFSKRSFPHVPRAMWWFLVFLAVYMLNGVLLGSTEFLSDLVAALFSITQLLVLFWIASDLLKDERIARSVLLAYTIAASLFAVGITLHVPGFYVEAGGRASAMGENPNAVAFNSAIALVIILGLVLYGSHRKRFLAALSLPLFGAMVLSGSRGGVLAFIMGCMVYLLPYRRSKRVLTAIFLASLAISAALYFVATNSNFMERWQRTYYEGSLEGREEIFSVAAEMILEQPILGWQPIDWFYELGRRLYGPSYSRGRDVHNLVLMLLISAGLLGAIPFLVGLWLCGRSAWRARLGCLGLLPLALLINVLVAGMSANSMASKTQWLVFALALATAPTNPGNWGNNSLPFGGLAVKSGRKASSQVNQAPRARR